MTTQTKIEWCDFTVNFWEGCQKVGPEDFYEWFNYERELSSADAHTAIFETVDF
ncbi:MAG: hypothetical protein AAGK79_13250 [Pseudomonadota bacterium]